MLLLGNSVIINKYSLKSAKYSFIGYDNNINIYKNIYIYTLHIFLFIILKKHSLISLNSYYKIIIRINLKN